jgi:C1A family cysteine protease
MNRRYDCHKPYHIDLRNQKLKTNLWDKITSLVYTEIDLRSFGSPIEDQGELGSCTSQATIGMVEEDRRIRLKDKTDYSRLFLYYNTRLIEGTINEDSGASLSDTIKALNKFGAPPEKECPYDITKFKSKPSSKAYLDGIKIAKFTYLNLTSPTAYITCLKQGFPFVIGIDCFSQIEDVNFIHPIIDLPKKGEESVGGHAICIVGLHKRGGQWYYIVRNSWGVDWGLRGYAYIPVSYINDKNLSWDAWTIRY